jgi:AcrR family transcriptional regulator
VATRRIGAETSESRAKLVRAAESLLLSEGYAAVTSRRVAAEAGLKPQLVHYYFRSMEDLYLEVFRWRSEQALEHLDHVLASPTPLTDLWALSNDRNWIALSIEFTALANHRKGISAEIARYGELFRERQMEVMTAALDRVGFDRAQISPEVALVLMTSLSRMLAMEAGLGMEAGHRETQEWVARWLDLMEGASAPEQTA